MSRMNLRRRLATTAAIVGMTAFGGVALASPALADTGHHSTHHWTYQPSHHPIYHPTYQATPGTPRVDASSLLAGLFAKQKAVGEVDVPKNVVVTLGDIMSGRHAASAGEQHLPTGPVKFTIGGLKLTLPAQVAQGVQAVLAGILGDQGYQVIYNDKNVLVIGDKICDPTKSKDWNKGCVNPQTDGRF